MRNGGGNPVVVFIVYSTGTRLLLAEIIARVLRPPG